jgi:hypothetical protein
LRSSRAVGWGGIRLHCLTFAHSCAKTGQPFALLPLGNRPHNSVTVLFAYTFADKALINHRFTNRPVVKMLREL